jgi:hypothetical protein
MPKHKNARSCPKTLYRVRNWSECDQALVHRGSIAIWGVDPESGEIEAVALTENSVDGCQDGGTLAPADRSTD